MLLFAKMTHLNFRAEDNSLAKILSSGYYKRIKIHHTPMTNNLKKPNGFFRLLYCRIQPSSERPRLVSLLIKLRIVSSEGMAVFVLFSISALAFWAAYLFFMDDRPDRGIYASSFSDRVMDVGRMP